MDVAVIISPDRQSIGIDLAECRRIPLSSDHETVLQRYCPAFSLIERWLTHHYEPKVLSPMAPAVVYRPIVVAVYETPDGRLIAETRPDLLHPDPSMRRPPDPAKPPLYETTPRKPRLGYWLILPDITAEWYRLAGIVRPTTGGNRQDNTDQPPSMSEAAASPPPPPSMPEAAASPPPPPSMPEAAPGPAAAGSEAPTIEGEQEPPGPVRKVPRGELDERAVAMLLKNPTLTCEQLAERWDAGRGHSATSRSAQVWPVPVRRYALSEKLSGEDRPGGIAVPMMTKRRGHFGDTSGTRKKK